MVDRPARVRTWAFGTVCLADAKEAMKAVQVETIQFLLLFGTCWPSFAAIQQCADDAGVVLFYLGWNCQLPILSDTFGKPAHCRCSLANALIELGVDRQIVTDRGPKARELVYHFKFIILSVKKTGGVCIGLV